MKKQILQSLSSVAAAALLLAAPIQASAYEKPATIGNPQYQYYFGVPHSHTSFSDAGGSSEPRQAYEYAKDKGLDYLFVTDHSNLFNADAFGEYDSASNSFSEKEGSEWYLTRMHAEAATSDTFLAGRGFEMTSSASNGGENYGHINVYNTDTYVEAGATMQQLEAFYTWLDQQDGAIAMFNHPNRPESSFKYLEYREEVDDKIQLIEVGNGSLNSNYLDTTDYYYKALDYGWHLAPVNSQDNHAANWGDSDNLTAVIAENTSEEAFYDAMRARRVYSTETRNLRLEVYANGQIMGSILDAGPGDTISFDIKASDPEEKISKIELISNGGKVIASKRFDTPVYTAQFKTDITASKGQSWYVVKVTHEDGRKGIGSAHYTKRTSEDIKIANLQVSPQFISLNSDSTASVQVLNLGTTAYTKDAEVTFYLNDEKIGTYKLDNTLDVGEATTITTSFRTKLAGNIQLRAELSTQGSGSVKSLEKNVSVIVPNGKKVLFDDSHKNIGVVNGTMLQFSEVLRLFGYQVTINEETITSELLNDIDVLILNTPTKDSEGVPSNKLTASEEQAVADFVRQGGGLLYATQSTDQSKYDPSQYNTLLEKLGSEIRFNHDGVHESREENQDNKNKQSFYSKVFPSSTLGINDDMYALRIYRGASLVNPQGTALTSDPSKNLEILAAANCTSYSGTVRDGAYTYATADERNGDRIPLVAAQKIGMGNIVVSGRYAYSNYEIGNDASNTAFYLNVVNYLAKLDNMAEITDIADLKPGDCVSVTGAITKTGVEELANTFYVMDDSGNVIAVKGEKTGVLPLDEGVRVIVNGKVAEDNGKKYLEYQSYEHQVLYIGMTGEVRFADMDGHWAADAVSDAAGRGLFQSNGNGRFLPDTVTSRAMAAQVLYLLAGTPETDNQLNFADVEDGQWYSDAIRWAAGTKIMTGDGLGLFRGQQAVTREQLAVMLYRFARNQSTDLSGSAALTYSDADEISVWAREAMGWATANGIIQGNEQGALNPQGEATRAEVAIMIVRLCDVLAAD